MKLTFVTPTAAEISSFISVLDKLGEKKGPFNYRYKGNDLHILITGAGVVPTAYSVTKYLQHQASELIVHVGTAKGLDPNASLNSVVQVKRDIFAGLEDDSLKEGLQFREKGGISTQSPPPFAEGWLHNNKTGDFLPSVTGVTTLSPIASAQHRTAVRKTHPEAEICTIDSAAFFYVCLQENISFLSIRAVASQLSDNISGPKSETAINNLNSVLVEMVDSLAV